MSAVFWYVVLCRYPPSLVIAPNILMLLGQYQFVFNMRSICDAEPRCSSKLSFCKSRTAICNQRICGKYTSRLKSCKKFCGRLIEEVTEGPKLTPLSLSHKNQFPFKNKCQPDSKTPADLISAGAGFVCIVSLKSICILISPILEHATWATVLH